MSKKAMKLALEALENAKANFGDWWDDEITALREALASEAKEHPAQSCVACEGNPQFPNSPCTLCGCVAEQPAQDNTYGYAKSLAEAIFKQHYASDEHYASGRIVWGVNDTVIGILTQIDNMVADMVRGAKQPAQQEPAAGQSRFPGVAWSQCDPAHVRMVLENPQEWKGYEVRYLYTSPPAQRKPLTEDELKPLMQKALVYYGYNPDNWYLSSGAGFFAFARAIEAAHGIKEST